MKGDKLVIMIPSVNKSLTKGTLKIGCYEADRALRSEYITEQANRVHAWMRENVPAKFYNALWKQFAEQHQRTR